MIIKEATFVASNAKLEQLPATVLPEFAFVGRSNVGKSSLINMLCVRNGLAKTSSKPGKTITINHFIINNAWYLVDLPGYGYAKRSKDARAQWRILMDAYLMKRSNLMSTFILVDSRIEPQKADLELMEWMGERGLPFVIVFTKSDKLGTTKRDQAVAEYKKQLLQKWEELPPYIVSSSELKLGREELLNYIEAAIPHFKSPLTQ
ncbi:MAG: YihA family ribosome biogenesis GTP-binding protein [Bacteroidales bacterium]|jgi:GTP-binding protein|nr:YihA family ribosome biogenesis GTP-binding protein [Bacteroidales bacterium]